MSCFLRLLTLMWQWYCTSVAAGVVLVVAHLVSAAATGCNRDRDEGRSPNATVTEISRLAYAALLNGPTRDGQVAVRAKNQPRVLFLFEISTQQVHVHNKRDTKLAQRLRQCGWRL